MNCLNDYLFNNRIDIKKSSYIWNMIAGIFMASEAVLLSIVVSRIIGLGDAGIITIGFAIGNLMATVGKYGVRTYQVTDVSKKYDFSSYFYGRLLTVFFMIISIVFYNMYCYYNKGYSNYKIIIVSLICFKFVVDSIDDVLGGECQKRDRLDISSKIYSLRSFCFILSFVLVVIVTKNVVGALIISLAVAVLLELLMFKSVNSYMKLSYKRSSISEIKEIIIKCTSLFLSAFFFFYITNAPKYAIDSIMNDEVQACYSFIAFPVFAIELLNNFIYQPVLHELAQDWTNKKIFKLKKRIYKQLLIITVLTMLALTVGFLIGIPVLSFIFSVDLSGYKTELLFLLSGGGLLAVIGYLSTILVTMRYSLVMFLGYIVDFFLSLFFYKTVITKYGVRGAVVLYCVLCFVFALYEYISILIIINKETKSAIFTQTK